VKFCEKKNGGNYLLVWDLLVWWGFEEAVELDFKSTASANSATPAHPPFASLYNKFKEYASLRVKCNCSIFGGNKIYFYP